MRTAGLWVVLTVVVLPWTRLVPDIGRHQIEIGLVLGMVLALAGAVSTSTLSRDVAKYAIQACVVMLGLRTDLNEVARAGVPGLVFAAGTILGTLGLGWLVGLGLKVEGKTSTLVSSGTAICGGSAIAAVSGVIGASAASISVATGTVFLLNAAALLVFPWLGMELGLTPRQFGTWAGVAIHDVSSVVGAAHSFAARYAGAHGAGAGVEAVDVATVVKLSRVVWIVPICLVAAWWMRRRSPAGGEPKKSAPVPWFVLLFVVAAAVRTFMPELVTPIAGPVLEVARSGMAGALFLIGAGLSVAALKAVGWRAMAQGVLLWVAISVAALMVVRAM
jgi:uncharacterized integral membrane protein (TIGR00698 family)